MTDEGPSIPAWAAILRHAIPVAGVLLLGWSALDFLLFFLLETWLFLTLRCGIEATLNRSLGRVPRTFGGVLAQIAFLCALSGLVMALVLGLLALVVGQLAFGPAEWERFRQAAVWRTPGFLAALVLLLADRLWDAGRFAVRIAPLPAPGQWDDLQSQRMVLRVVFLAAAGVAAGVLPTGGGRAIVVALSVAMAMLDAWPAAAAPAGRPTASDAAGGAARRSRRRQGRSRRG